MSKFTSLTGLLTPLKKLSTGKKVALGAVTLLVVAGAVKLPGLLMSDQGEAEYIYDTVTRRTIVSTLESSGTVEPLDSYTVIATVTGDILSAPFEEGDIVEEGALLYQIDTTKAQNNYTQSLLSLQSAKEDLDNLTVTAPAAGQIIAIHCEQGDDVKNGELLIELQDRQNMELEIPFLSSDAAAITPGQTATVTLTATGEQLTGTVDEVSSVEQVSTGGTITRNVTIDVKNPGGLTEATYATAKVSGLTCTDSASFTYAATENITAEVSGDVNRIAVKEGDIVSKGQTLIKLSSTQVEQSYTKAELNLSNAQEDLDEYTITAPIKGTIIDKGFKAGDTIDPTNSSNQMAIIYDMSQLTFDMSIDELDIGSIEVGQEVIITADALEGESFTGKVTKVSINGTSSMGVTAYPVTVTIDDAGDLLPGMNIDAVITLEEAENTLTIPITAVSRGNMVLVKDNNKTSNKNADKSDADTDKATQMPAPDGYSWREVTLGMNDSNYIEVLSGLEEGDEIAISAANMVVSGNSNSSEMMPGMGGMPGGMGGGMSGGMGGGMPSGGGGMPGGGGGMGGGMPGGR